MSALALLVVDTATAAVRGYAGMLLAVAGLAKLRDRLDFEAILAAYRLLPNAVTAPAACTLPVIEVLIGAALFVPAAGWLAAPAAATLLALFAIAVATNLLRGRRDLDCGCGTGVRIGWPLALGNLALAALLVATIPADPPPLLLLASGTILGIGLYLCRRVVATMAALPPLTRSRA